MNNSFLECLAEAMEKRSDSLDMDDSRPNAALRSQILSDLANSIRDALAEEEIVYINP